MNVNGRDGNLHGGKCRTDGGITQEREKQNFYFSLRKGLWKGRFADPRK